MDKYGLRVTNPLENVYHMEDVWGAYSTLVVGQRRALLVDTGTGVCDLASEVKELTSLPLTVVNTHGHCDHIGGNYQFERVLLSPEEKLPAEIGVSDSVKRRVLALIPPETLPECFDEAGFMSNTLDNAEPLYTDAVFELGGERVSVVELRNHTEGSVGFLCENKRLLLTGDAAAPFIYLFFPESCSLTRHAEILRELARDARFERMLCSHSGQLMEKRQLDLFIQCAENAKTGRSVKFTDPIFPEFLGRKHVEMPEADVLDCAAIIFNPDKL